MAKSASSVHSNLHTPISMTMRRAFIPRPCRKLISRCLQRRHLLSHFRAAHKNYGKHYDCASGKNKSAYALMQDQPPQKDGHDRIHISIGRYLRRGHMLEQPDVSRVADPRPADDEVGDRADSARSPHYAMKIFHQQSENEIRNSRCRYLPPGGA